MSKNRVLVVLLAMLLIMGAIPFALGVTPQTSTPVSNSVYISSLYVGAPHQTINQEYVKITNKGTTAVKMSGWKIKDSGAKHTYYFPSTYTLGSKSTVTIYTGKGTNTATKLYWGSSWYIWNNDGDTAYLYNSQNKLVSTRNG